MKNHLPDSLLSQLSELVAARMALHFPRERWSDLERNAISAAKEFGFADAQAFVQWLLAAPLTREQVDLLASHLTIAETYFWREPRVFDALAEQILPQLIQARETGERRLRIWSAGCATGEEPYSIAIAVCRALPLREDWNITLLATDINPRILQRAAVGVYGEWSFRNVPPWLKAKYFSRTDAGKLEIRPEIREMVTFGYLNLAEDIYPSPLNNTNAMDIIFCRNVLMYFASERAREIGQNLHHALVEGGWLMVASSEVDQVVFSQFASFSFPGAIVYQKNRQKAQPPVVFRPAAMATQAPVQPLPEPPTVAVTPRAPPPQRRQREVTPTVERAAPEQSAYAQALTLYAQGLCAEVIEKLDGKAPRARALVVRALANQGKLAEASALCEQAIAADKLDPGLHFLGATILQEQNRESEAIAALKRALYLDSNFALAHFALGNLLLRAGNAPAARKSFENALALLNACPPEDSVPESDGLTAGRFKEIIHLLPHLCQKRCTTSG